LTLSRIGRANGDEPVVGRHAPDAPLPNSLGTSHRASFRRNRELARALGEDLYPGCSFIIADRWNVRDKDARRLLCSVSNGPSGEMKDNPNGRLLDADWQLRTPYLFAIFTALNTRHGGPFAERVVMAVAAGLSAFANLPAALSRGRSGPDS
jgi:hypothetical protein